MKYNAQYFNCDNTINRELIKLGLLDYPSVRIESNNRNDFIEKIKSMITHNKESYGSVLIVTHNIKNPYGESLFSYNEYITDDNSSRVISFIERMDESMLEDVVIYEEDSFEGAYQMCLTMREGHSLAYPNNDSVNIRQKLDLANKALWYIRSKEESYKSNLGIDMEEELEEEIELLRDKLNRYYG